jgi:hypothetical protein
MGDQTMRPGIHDSDFCSREMAKVKEYPSINHTGMLIARSNSQQTFLQQGMGLDVIHKPAGGRDEKVCGHMD